MPIITANILAGRNWETRQAFMRALTDAATETLKVEASAVRVILVEVPPEHWAAGGQPKGLPKEEQQ